MRLLEPSRIPPLEVDLRRVILAGMAAWLVALTVVAVLALAGVPTGRGGWICAAGVALGLWALAWERRRRATLSAAAAAAGPATD